MSSTWALRPGARSSSGGSFSWHELATDDWGGALEFYGDLFGWEATDAFEMGEMGTYQMYGLDGVPYGGMYDAPDGPPSWLIYARVGDIQDALARVLAGGGETLSGPMEVPGGDVVVQCVDPHGATFALHQTVDVEAQRSGDGDSAETARSGGRTTGAAG